MHNTLAEDIYNKNRDKLKLRMLNEFTQSGCEWGNCLSAGMNKVLINKAEELSGQEYPQITLSDYRRFSRDGNREYFEDKYFTRRRMLTAFVLAECVENRGRFLDRILDGLYLILEETTWCLPAHNTYIRDTKQLEIADGSRPVIDLFAAETAEVTGLCESLLRDRFSAISPFISEYVDSKIQKRILEPYLSYHFWWMGNGLEPMCNWTPWITQNVLLSVFSRPEGSINTDTLMQVLDQAVKSVDYFLDEYGTDGCCNEGAQYYEHAGLCLFGCIDVLNRITDNAFASMYDDELIRNMAAYILKMYVGDGYYINYADCSPFPGRRTVRDYAFALAVGNDAYAAFAADDFRKADVCDRLMFDEQNLYYHLLLFIYHDRMMRHAHTGIRAEDSYFESTGLFIARDEHYTFAIKAGNNADSHNHNDVGSMTLYKDNKPFLIDLGVETYTQKTFSKNRYDIWTMQSLYHNTVNFRSPGSKSGEPDILQKDGNIYRAGDVSLFVQGSTVGAGFEMAAAYGDDRIVSVYRRAELIKGSGVRVTDSYDVVEGIEPVITLMVYERPELIDEDTLKIGELGLIRASGIGSINIQACPIVDDRLKKAWKHDCYRILLYVTGETSELIIS